MYKWFLAWRYLHTKFVALFGVAGVTLCVAMVLVVMSVMGGFLETIRTRSKGMLSEIVLDSGSLQGFPLYDEFIQHLYSELPDTVRLASPTIYSYAIFRVPSSTQTNKARVMGIRLDEFRRLNDFGKGLYYDRYFPGTTSLASQAMPVAGFDDLGTPTLPPDLQAASKQWMEKETDEAALSAFRANPFDVAYLPRPSVPSPGDRIFAIDAGEPRYEGPKYPGAIIGCDLLNDRRSDGKFNRWYARGTMVALGLMPLTPSGNLTGEPLVRVALRYVVSSQQMGRSQLLARSLSQTTPRSP